MYFQVCNREQFKLRLSQNSYLLMLSGISAIAGSLKKKKKYCHFTQLLFSGYTDLIGTLQTNKIRNHFVTSGVLTRLVSLIELWFSAPVHPCLPKPCQFWLQSACLPLVTQYTNWAHSEILQCDHMTLDVDSIQINLEHAWGLE